MWGGLRPGQRPYGWQAPQRESWGGGVGAREPALSPEAASCPWHLGKGWGSESPSAEGDRSGGVGRSRGIRLRGGR